MPSPVATSTPLARRVVATVGAVAGALTLLVWITGGAAFTIGGLRISSRNATRPALVALVCGAILLWRMSAAERRTLASDATARVDRLAPWAAAFLALVVGLTSATFSAHVAGGADSSGYLSQSRRWASGAVQTPVDDIAGADWPVRGRLISPLGYAPAATLDRIAPTYAPGLPWLMVAGAALAGEPGRYLWTPLLAALLVWGTFALTRRHAPPGIALAASLLVASSPPVLFESMQTMSDLPVAALWLLAFLCLSSTARGTALAGGVLAGLAVAVRPNLVLVAAAMWTAWLLTDHRPWRTRLARAALFAAPLAVGALAIAAVNDTLWGSPLRSGYGANADIYSSANVATNLANLWRWIGEAGVSWWPLGLIALLWLAVTKRAGPWTPALAVVVAVVASYLPYAVFAEWWYLRFYLPAWPFVAAAVVVVAWQIAARWARPVATLAVLATTGVVAAGDVARAQDFAIFDLWRGEQRYPAVAIWVRDHTAPNAVVWSVQHSGAISYYAGRTIGRYDWLDTANLDSVSARLDAAGRQVLLVVEDWEEPQFRDHFAGQVLGRLDWAPLAEARAGTTRVRVYDLATPTRAVAPALIATPSSLWPAARLRRPAPPK